VCVCVCVCAIVAICPVQHHMPCPAFDVLGLFAGADAVAIRAFAGNMIFGAEYTQIAAAIEVVMQRCFRITWCRQITRVHVVSASLLGAGLSVLS